MKGQKSRSGGGVRRGFEGGQTPLYRRLPKYVGHPFLGHTKKKYNLIKLEMLNRMPDGSTVDYQVLHHAGIAHKTPSKRKKYKVMGGAEIPLTVKNLTVRAHAFSANAREQIEQNGGTCVEMGYSETFANLPHPQYLALREQQRKERYLRLINIKDELVARQQVLLSQGNTKNHKSVRRCKKIGLSIINKYVDIVQGTRMIDIVKTLPEPRVITLQELKERIAAQ